MHGGSSGAVAAMMPEEIIGVVVLVNRGCGIVYMLMHDIFDRMLGIPRTWTDHDWLVDAEENPAREAAANMERLEAARKKDTQPSLPLSDYAGAYECDLYRKLELLEHDGLLRLQFGPNMTGSLLHGTRHVSRETQFSAGRGMANPVPSLHRHRRSNAHRTTILA
jgi:hypothetical protein